MDVSVHDHLRPPDDAEFPRETYRVVGVGEESATLLRVTDGGRRANTGHVVHVDSEDLAGFDRVGDPDAGFSPLGTIREGFEGIAIWIRGLFR